MQNIEKLITKHRYKHIFDMAKKAGTIGSNKGLRVYIVGGVVRDLLLEREIQDLDLMVEGDGISFAKDLANDIGIRKIVPFKKFGTALIPHKDFQIEVASSRSESYGIDSRSPTKVIFTSLEEDLKRRDFTINAMAMDIHPENFGKIYDPFNGQSDLSNNILKTPIDPKKTFSDDPLRMMRAAYFASKLNFKLNSDCRAAIKGSSKRISIVSWERIRDELIKILSTAKPSIGLVIMQKAGLLEMVFPEIDVMYDMDQSPEWHHKDIFAHTLQVVDNAAKLTNKMEIRFAALVHDIAKPITRKIDPVKGYTFHGHDAIGERMLNKVAKRLRLSNHLAGYIKKLTLLHLRPIAIAKSEVSDSAVRRLMVAAGEEIEDLMTLCRADITTKNSNRIKRYLKNFDLVEEKMKTVMSKDSAKTFQSPVRGKEIMEIFKIKEGKLVGELKKSVEEAILEGVIDNNYISAKKFLINKKLS